jgi:ATPase subunit of ABC transporter with duplicated ATPase domains
MIELRGLSHGFLKKSLFQDVNIRINANERYGIVGANGSGKSTLLKIIAGEVEADSGEIDFAREKSLFRIGQDHTLNDDIAIVETAMMGQADVFRAIKQKDELLKKSTTLALSNEIIELEEFIQNNEGYRLRSRSESILEGLGIPTSQQEKPLKTLSGGYKWRVFLASALVKNPDILMLDEPTNHLDIVSIHWLELFLSNYNGLIILVSHDKKFMDHVCTQILDIDFNTITAYTGNYSSFERARDLFLLQKEKEIISQEKEIAKKQAFIERFRYKASKARQAQSRVKQLERLEIVEPIKSSRLYPKFMFEIIDPGSKEVLAVKNLNKSYGEKDIIKNFSFNVRRGEKIAIIGPNGSGKSTLIKALAQQFHECEKSIKWGHNTALGYFAQNLASKFLNKDKNILDWFWQFCADKPQSFVQGMLGRVLFFKDDAKKNIKDLSGGELSRLYLAYLMLIKPNVLLLDEPTNHLDLESIESLTLALRDYKGTIILVSHDRIFIDRIADRIIELSSDGINDFLGSYSGFVALKDRDYLDGKKELSKERSKNEKTLKKTSFEQQKKRRSQSQKLKKNLDCILLSIEEVEAKINKIENQFLDENLFKENNFEKIVLMQREKDLLKQRLASLIEEWEKIEIMLSCLSEDGENKNLL